MKTEDSLIIFIALAWILVFFLGVLGMVGWLVLPDKTAIRYIFLLLSSLLIFLELFK
jgi:hypothetical protein